MTPTESDSSTFAGLAGVHPAQDNFVVRAYGETDPGMVRESNQDSFVIDTESGLYLVADGMGGRAGGEVASRLAVTSIQGVVSRHLGELVAGDPAARRNRLAQAVNWASLKIYERSLELPQYRGMGTTSTLLWIPPLKLLGAADVSHAIVAHVGDSRCYLLRAGLLYQVTDDHSLVNEQVKAGILRRGDPLVTQMRNVITRCVGYQEEEEVDTFALGPRAGDRYLLCSDGLTNKVRDLEIASWLSSPSIEKAPKELIHLANERGGEDNITVVIVALD